MRRLGTFSLIAVSLLLLGWGTSTAQASSPGDPGPDANSTAQPGPQADASTGDVEPQTGLLDPLHANGTASTVDPDATGTPHVPVQGPGVPHVGGASGGAVPVSDGGSVGASGSQESPVAGELLGLGAPGWGLLGVGLLAVAVGTWRSRGSSLEPEPAAEDEPARTPQDVEDPPGSPTEAVRFDRVPDGPSPTPERSVVEHPGAPGALLLGRRALASDRPDLAKRWFEVAVRLEPGDATAHLCLGVSLRAAGEPEQAAHVLGRASELDPTNALARLQRARALVEAEQMPEALEALAPLAGVDPEVDATLRDDAALAPLGDHPRFLALVGEL